MSPMAHGNMHAYSASVKTPVWNLFPTLLRYETPIIPLLVGTGLTSMHDLEYVQ